MSIINDQIPYIIHMSGHGEEFWAEKWKMERPPWQNQHANDSLDRNFDIIEKTLNIPLNESTCFIPLCGRDESIDLISKRVKKVIGSELIETPCIEYFKMKSIPFEKRGNSIIGDNIEFIIGDVFNLTNISADWVYDRAALVALPKDLHKSYVEHLWRNAIGDVGTYFFVSFEHDDVDRSGPPCNVPEEYVDELFKNLPNVKYIDLLEKVYLYNKLKHRDEVQFKMIHNMFPTPKFTEGVYLIRKDTI